MTQSAAPVNSPSKIFTLGWSRLQTATLIFILVAGVALRAIPLFGVPDRITLDEYLYITNVVKLEKIGPFEYSGLVRRYVEAQSQMDTVMLPPTRCNYILLGWTWDALFHAGPQMSLRYVAAMFSVFGLLLSAIFACRLGGIRLALVTSSLMAVSPIELMLAHRELVDGVFAFWALLSLWLLWENMQRPGRLGWMAAYAGSIAVMVLTKENAFFATVALGGILCTAGIAPGLQLGKPARSLFVATFLGGLAGVAVLLCLAGSAQTLIETYRLLVTKAEGMSYAYQTGGGPWYHYLVDLVTVSPMVMLPAIGGMFALRRENRQGIYLLLFILFSCAVMVNVKNGMNLRYATMWDMPLRFLAAGTILRMAGGVRKEPVIAAVALVALVAASELHNYWLIFVHHDLGDPITQFLMYTTEIVRVGAAH